MKTLGSVWLISSCFLACGGGAADSGGAGTDTGGAAGAAGSLDAGGGGAPGGGGQGAGGTAGSGGLLGVGGADAGDVFVDVLVPPPDYADDATWLCLPGSPDDVCAESLDADAVEADGSIFTETHVVAADPAIDCFYVYPTISLDSAGNSDLDAGSEEIDIVQQQAARLSSTCRLYAPLYRQVTLAALFGTITPERDATERRAIAYGDVLDAWNYYLDHHNQGRGFVLIGHSQGAGILRQLVQETIDGDAARRAQLVAAYIVGSSVAVPDGLDVGGDFQNVPACRDQAQTGCVVSYSTFAAAAPPPDDSLFGAPRTGGGVALCVNPAAPAGGSAELTPYWATDGGLLDVTALSLTEPYVTFPRLLTGECVTRNGFNVLEVTVQADPADPRPDSLDGRLPANWGLHLIDLHLTMGDVEAMVAAQAAAFVAP